MYLSDQSTWFSPLESAENLKCDHLQEQPLLALCGFEVLLKCEISRQAFPQGLGVFRILDGSDDMGAWLVEHPGTPMIASSGHTRTGKIQKMAAKNLESVTLLL